MITANESRVRASASFALLALVCGTYVEACVTAPGASTPSAEFTWQSKTWKSIEFPAPPSGECLLRLVINEAASVGLKLERSDQKKEWSGYFFSVERPGPHGGKLAYGSVRNEEDSAIFALYESGEYLIRIRRWALKESRTPSRGERYRLSVVSYVRLAKPQLLRKESRFGAALQRGYDMKLFPFRLQTRSRLHFAVAFPITTDDVQSRLQYGAKVLDARGWEQTSTWSGFGIQKPDGKRRMREFEVLLEPGTYTLVVHREFNALIDLEKSQPLTAEVWVDEVVPAEIPVAAQPLVSWLDATGLSAHLKFIDLYVRDWNGATPPCPAPPFDEYERTLYAAAVSGLASDKARRSASKMDDLVWVKNACDKSAPQVAMPRGAMLRAFVRMNTTLDRFDLDKLEKEFMETVGTTVWSRIFVKIGSSVQLTPSQILLRVPVDCSASDVTWRNGMAERRGTECMSAKASTFITNLPDLAKTVQGLGVDSPVNLGPPIAQFLSAYYPPRGAKVEFLERSENYVEAVIRGLRGEVLAGGKDWERLQVSVYLVPSSKTAARLFVSVDGRVASGIGNYPSDTNFITDMEPKHAGALTEYTRKLLNDIQEALKLGGK